MNKQELITIVRDTDNELLVPDGPEDENTPIMFGSAGFVVSTKEGSMVLSTSDCLEDLLDDPFLSLSANLFGHLMFVSFGAIAEVDRDTGHPLEDSFIPTRIIIGVSREGAFVSAMRRLDTNQAIMDTSGFAVQGSLRETLLEIAKS